MAHMKGAYAHRRHTQMERPENRSTCIVCSGTVHMELFHRHCVLLTHIAYCISQTTEKTSV